MPEHKVIHICNSHEPSLDQNLQISMPLPTPCRMKENNEMATMAKKHRGFGGKLEFRASIENRQTKILIMKKEK